MPIAWATICLRPQILSAHQSVRQDAPLPGVSRWERGGGMKKGRGVGGGWRVGVGGGGAWKGWRAGMEIFH